MIHTPHSALDLFIHRLHTRSALSGDEIATLRSIRGHQSLAGSNVDIVSPGDTTECATLVVAGLVGRFGVVIDGRRQITALHVAGEMCDLHSVVTPDVSWALQALSPAAILRVPHRELRRVAGAHPRIAEAFWRDCSVDASVLAQWVVNVGRRDARARMAHLFCEMGIRMENAGLGERTRFRLDATQAQLGDALGLTSVHVNRTLTGFRESGVLQMRGREIHVLDWDELARIGDCD